MFTASTLQSGAAPAIARLWLALALLALAGCSIGQPRVPVDRFLAGDYEAVRTFASEQAHVGPSENLALVRNVEAQCDLMLGDFDAARRSFAQAGQIMGTWSVSSGEATAAIVGSESSKTYKGDPYEKAMNAFYLAYCYLVKGEPDNARAALKRGILMDAEVADAKYQADNALLFWMAGRMTRLYGGSGEDGYYDEARTAHKFALEHGARGEPQPDVLANPQDGNVVVLLPIGLGPEKYGDGGQEELARFRPQRHPAVGAEVFVDGQSIGRSAILSDVDYQAMTLGGTAMEGIRKGKAVFKTATTTAGIVLIDQALSNASRASRRGRGEDRARRRDRNRAAAQAIVGGTLLLLGALTSAAADVRHWPTLPSTVQVVTANVLPGEHQLRIEFLGGNGRPIQSLRRTLRVEVPMAGERWLLVPSLPLPQAKRAPFSGPRP
ncbi:MAG: hypothetical protein AB8H80_00970 [Planctomycetota bacterium]